ncbi:MAG: hypothetical protein JO041_00145 [Acidobacteria bacterium]|nr:hypothetical protein [Acidobacteriota bacterium]
MATLHDDDFGISLQYPWQYGFKSGHKLRSSGEPVETGFVAPGGVNLGTIEVPAGYYTGTDFKRAFLSANVNGKLASDQCSQFSAGQNNESPVPAKMQIGNREFLMQETKADDSIRRTYHTYQSGVCYEFVLGLDTADSNSDQRIKPAPVKRVFARLENILATVDIADQDGTAEASAATGNPVPQKP